ncbi:putative WRKY transcription factor 32 [Nicotiana tabacum]|uniref:WRKY transcription factor 32 n=2 Tax=Nicotiana TaxID=4085 RepID=A0A1S4CV83_TOBAC|nr:PREDICTED: probable WRKY transcription factor 32 [Nicotiana sylvestris]XP_016505021.1 PREDICTED: probable WRKY transcription factor 32 [Nicotiana tabacum]
MDEENESSKAAGAEKSNLEENKNDNSSVHDGGVLDDGGGERKESGIESLRELKVEISVSENLAPTAHSSVQQIESDVQSKFDTDSSSSHQLSEVPVEYALPPFEPAKEIKDKISVTRPETLSAQVQTEHQQRMPDEASSLERSPTSVTPAISSVSSPTLAERHLSAVVNGSTGEVAKRSSDAKVLPIVPVLKTPSRDGYNWRKYGQKQVKIPQGSRSYYRCTHSECCAKKIECSDHTNRVMEIIYRSQHNHDPPPRVNCSKESKPVVLPTPANDNRMIACPNRSFNETVPSSLKENLQETSPIAEKANQDSCGSDTDTEITIKEEHSDEPEQKKRLKKSDASSESVSRPGKKPKLVVHAACDVGISSDGYRWRKYGQKMVKGNPHPRNYYRCTSAGCPVRKHIERAVDSTSALIITYKGVHDHDMPVPKKRQSPPSAPLIAAAASASLTNLHAKKPELLQHQKSTTQWSVDKEGALTGEKLDLGGEKAMESARTLLSIGFEIKPC